MFFKTKKLYILRNIYFKTLRYLTSCSITKTILFLLPISIFIYPFINSRTTKYIRIIINISTSCTIYTIDLTVNITLIRSTYFLYCAFKINSENTFLCTRWITIINSKRTTFILLIKTLSFLSLFILFFYIGFVFLCCFSKLFFIFFKTRIIRSNRKRLNGFFNIITTTTLFTNLFINRRRIKRTTTTTNSRSRRRTNYTTIFNTNLNSFLNITTFNSSFYLLLRGFLKRIKSYRVSLLK